MSSSGTSGQTWLKRIVEDVQPVVRTSRPYPLASMDALVYTGVTLLGDIYSPTFRESMEFEGVYLVSGEHKKEASNEITEGLEFRGWMALDGSHERVRLDLTLEVEGLSYENKGLISADHKLGMITHTTLVENNLDLTPVNLLEGTLE